MPKITYEKKNNDYVIKKVAVCNYDEWVNYLWKKILGQNYEWEFLNKHVVDSLF